MTCAFIACEQVTSCILIGGCVGKRFTRTHPLARVSDLKPGARALAGTTPRQVRDPRFIKRKRKALTK